MRRILSGFVFLLCASWAVAASPGSYAVVTSMLTLTSSSFSQPTVLKNGSKETKSTWATYKVTNAAILSECQRQNILTPGNVSGWQIYGVFAAHGGLQFFVISNGLQTLRIDSVMSVSRADVAGFATKGKWVEDSSQNTISGTTTYLDGFTVTVSISGVSYVSTCAPQIQDKVVGFGVLSETVWRPAAFQIRVIGLPGPDSGNESIMQGSLNFSAAKANWDLGLSLLGFPGFDT